MRYKVCSSKIAVAIVALYILTLAFLGKLSLYIHGRYIIFTVVLSIVTFILITVSIYHEKIPIKSKFHISIGVLPLLFIITLALLLPARSLTSATASQRNTSLINIDAGTGSNTVANIFAKSSQTLQLHDWARVLELNPNPQYYQNKTAKVSGFIFDGGLGENTFMLARFIVTCCAIDARPIGVPVYVENWKQEYTEDQWIEIVGEFQEQHTAEGIRIELLPTTIQIIEEPANPYGN